MDFWCEVVVKESDKVTRFYRGKNAQMIQVFSHQSDGISSCKDLIVKNLKFLFGDRPFKILKIQQF